MHNGGLRLTGEIFFEAQEISWHDGVLPHDCGVVAGEHDRGLALPGPGRLVIAFDVAVSELVAALSLATFAECALLRRLRFRHRLPQRQVGFRPAISAVWVPDDVGISHGKDSFCGIP